MPTELIWFFLSYISHLPWQVELEDAIAIAEVTANNTRDSQQAIMSNRLSAVETAQNEKDTAQVWAGCIKIIIIIIMIIFLLLWLFYYY